jgi:hypothetical protein
VGDLMASTSRTVRVRFDGNASGLAAASRKAAAELELFKKQADDADKGLSRLFTGTAGGVLKLGSAVSTVQALGGALHALAPAAGVAAVLPAVALAGAAAMTTWKLATSGFGDALSAAMAKDPAAYAKAVAELAPAAKATAGAVRELQPELHALQQSVQDRFFTGFADDVRGLGKTYLPVLKTGMTGVAGEMNAMGRYAATALMAPSAVSDVNAVLGGTQSLFRGLRPSVGDVLTGVLALGGQGSSSLGGLGDAVSAGAAKFKQWAIDAAAAGKVTEWIDAGVATLKQFGAIAGNVGGIVSAVWRGLSADGTNLLTNLDELTAGVEAFLKSAEGQDALRALGEALGTTAEVARTVFLTALRELGPVIVELAPAAEEVARAVGDLLVGALHTVGPALQDVAGFLSTHKQLLGDLVPILAAALVAYKGFKVASEVAGWVGTASTALGLFGKAADDAGGRVDGLTTKTKLLRGAAGAVGLAVLVTGLAEVQRSTEGADGSVSDFNDTLQDLSGAVGQLASGNFGGIGKDMAAEWTTATSTMKATWQGFINEVNGLVPSPIVFDADAGPARTQVTSFMNEVNARTPMVNIDGRTEGAAQALADILQAIQQGRGEVLIDGNPVPVQDALSTVMLAIDRANGEVDINGNPLPAGGALAELINQINTSPGGNVPIGADTKPFDPMMRDGVGAALAGLGTPLVPVGANTAGFIGAVGEATAWGSTQQSTGTHLADILPALQGFASSTATGNAQQSTGTHLANNSPAIGAMDAATGHGNASSSMGLHDANNVPGLQSMDAATAHGNASRSRGTHDANNAPAIGAADAAKAYGDRQRARMTVDADDGPARGVINTLRSWASRAVSFVVSAITGNAAGALMMPSSPAVGFAGGGLAAVGTRQLRPMSGHTATVVAPNTWRVVGDNLTYPELYAPLDGSTRSLRLIEAAALLYGRRLVPLDAVGFAAGGMAGSPARGYLSALDTVSRGPQPAAVAAAAPAPQTYVTVVLDGEPIRATVRTELARADRETRRTVLAGGGQAYR